MAVVQSTYAATLPVGYPGMVANAETSNRISRTVEDAAGIGFGVAVFRGTGDHGVTATASANLVGITIADKTVVHPTGSATPDSYPQYATAAIMTMGVIWVEADGATTDGAAVYVDGDGAFTATATDNTALTGWAFQDTTTAGGLVRIARR